MFSKRLIFFSGCLLLVASVVSTPAYAKKNGGQSTAAVIPAAAVIRAAAVIPAVTALPATATCSNGGRSCRTTSARCCATATRSSRGCPKSSRIV